jgi:hypothetical protein
MITDEEVLSLFTEADPARAGDGTPRGEAARYLDTLRMRSTDMTLTDISTKPTEPSRHHWWLFTAAAVALVVLAAGAVALVVRDDSRPVDQPPPVEQSSPMQVANDFVAAYTAYDANTVASLLAPDADVSGMFQRSDWRLGLRYMDAIRMRLLLTPCEETASSPSLTVVKCFFNFHALGSDELGLGSFGPAVIGLTIRDGKVIDAETNVPYALTDDKFKTQVWEPFAAWMRAMYPGQIDLLYTDATMTAALITEDSVPLWETRTREYDEDVLAGTTPTT